LFGWLLLGEQLTWNFFAGGVLIVIGVAMAVLNAPEEVQLSLQE
jgi:drug/metabolite transporter (DMT)-like permease